MNLSPPFQIGDPLNDLEKEDFAEIFPDEGELHIEPVGGGLSGAKIYRVTFPEPLNQYIVRYSSGIFGPQEIFNELAIQKTNGRNRCFP